ncbi:MAG: hypothetical protein NUV51_12580 [Sulfuricaulis sp.]|nr:hypothetical protein [Sulfuricaulis sp.]
MNYDPHEIAAAAALCPETVDRLVKDGAIDLYDLQVKIGGQFVAVPLAMHEASVRMTQGRYPEADCIAGDCIGRIAAALLPWAREESQRLMKIERDRAAGEDYFGREAA